MASINEALTCADGDATTPPHHVIDIENESAVDNQSQDVIIVEEDDGEDGMKTPKRQTALQKKLQQVFDLSRKSSEATYQWMRCGFYFFMHALCVTGYLNFLCSCDRSNKPATNRTIFGEASSVMQKALFNDIQLQSTASLRITSRKLHQQINGKFPFSSLARAHTHTSSPNPHVISSCYYNP